MAKYNVFNKEIEIDDTNKGIRFYLDEMCESINEICVTYRHRLKRMMKDKSFTSERAAQELRKMSSDELKKNILQNIKLALEHEDYAKEYAKYISIL